MQINDPMPAATQQTPAIDLPFYRKLGRTDLSVSCLGIGGGGGLSSEDTLYAFDRGINYFFYSSDLHHHIYSSMSEALQKLCGRGSAVREKVVLATVTYMKGEMAIMPALIDQFTELKTDYIDIFFWGWIGTNKLATDVPIFENCMNTSEDLRGSDSLYQRYMEQMFGASEKLRKMGAVRYIGASFHDLNMARQWLDSSLLDVVMVRHNVAHRTAQNQVFNNLHSQDRQRPGTVIFKSAGMFNALWQPPYGLPSNCWSPSVPDLYRYSLSQNCVDVNLMGPETRAHVDAALAGVQKGKLTTAELDYLNMYGDMHRQTLNFQDIPSDKLIYQE
jgi:predicted aldo/keto reductase-like oxidoreductase